MKKIKQFLIHPLLIFCSKRMKYYYDLLCMKEELWKKRLTKLQKWISK